MRWDDKHGPKILVGQTNEKTMMAWLSWGKVCTPKKEGGLGFWDNFSQIRVEASNKYIISGL